MANQPIPFNKSSYYLAHPRMNEVFVKNILLPELKKQGVLGQSSRGIELPVGTNQAPEYISLAEAKELILEYFINTINLPERDQRVLNSASSYSDFSDLATNLFSHDIAEPVTLAAQISPEKLAPLQKTQPRFSSDQTIRDYNDLYLKILKVSSSGNSTQILARLFPGGITEATNISQIAFAQVIVSNLTRLNQAANSGTTSELKNYAVAKEFSKILNNYPELAGYRNYLGNDAIQTYLAQYVSSVATQAAADDPGILDKFNDTQREYGKKLKQYLPNESELREQIYQNLPPMSDKDRRTLTDQILRASTKNSLDGVGLDQIVKELRLDQDAQNKIFQTLHDTGVDVSLEYQQGRIRFLVDHHHLTSGELNLLKKGINPFLTTQNPNDKIFVDKEREILALYNEKPTNRTHPFTTLKEAYDHENQQDNPDLSFVNKSRDLLNRQRYYTSLTPQELARVRSTRLGRWLTNTSSRMSDLQDKLTDRVFDLTDTVTGKKWLHKQFENWEKFSSKITVPGTNIPLFRINSWVIDQFEAWKKAKVLNLISTSSNWKSPLGKFAHARLKDYQLGDFTIKGMVSVGLYRTWSNFAYKASNKIIKGGLILSTRTLKRLLITVGGKALAKIGLRAITTLSGIFTVVGIVLIVKDVLDIAGGVLKWGWEQIKKIVPTTEGAVAAVITGITGLVSVGWAGAISALMALLGPMVVPGIISIVTLISIVYGSIYFFTWQEHGLNLSVNLDPGEFNQSSFNGLPPNLWGRVSNCGSMDLGKDITAELAGKVNKGTVALLPLENFARNEKTRWCIIPTMIIMHWSDGRDDSQGDDATRSTLIAREVCVSQNTPRAYPSSKCIGDTGWAATNVLACQLATDTDDVMFMQPFYEKGVELAQCAGEWNNYAIQNEMSGTGFTDQPGGPPKPEILERALEVTCLMMKTYHIPATQIFGHYQVPNNGGKTDPGKEFLQNYFIPKVKERCG